MLSQRRLALLAKMLSEELDVAEAEAMDQMKRLLLLLDEPEQEEAIGVLCDALIPESARPAEDVKAVRCLTMHGSKGLTKKTVVMPGLEAALLPGTAKDDDLAEKKRLFYVALTRATDEVMITYPRTRARGDPFNYAAEGRGRVTPFVQEAGITVVPA